MMRRMSWILAVTVLSMPLAAEQQDCAKARPVCTARDALESYLAAQEAGIKDGAFVIAYDHQRGDGWWSGYRWRPELDEGCRLDDLPASELELRAEGHPRLTLPQGSRLHAFVVATNPYAYTVTPGDGKQADHEDLAELQSLALLMGATTAGVLQTSAVELPPVDPISSTFIAPPRSRRPSPPPPPPPPLWIEPLTQELKSSSGLLKSAAKIVGATTAEVQKSLVLIESSERFLRDVETTSLVEPTPPAVPLENSLHQQFMAVESARSQLAGLEPFCLQQLVLIHRLTRLRLLSRLPTDLELAEFHEALGELASIDTCDPSLLSAADWFVATPLEDPLHREYRAPLRAGERELSSYRRTLAKRSEVLGLSKALLDKEKAAGTRASLLAHVLARVPKVPAKPCHLTHGVLPVARAEGANVSVPWNKVRTETFTIAFDENLKGIVTPTRAKRDEKYELQVASPWRNFNIDLGLVHSNIRQHTYSAVASSTVGEGESVAASEEGDSEESRPPLQIARTQSEKLSGDVAMFVSWLPDRFDRGGISAGPQIGVGLDTDHPAAFAGFVLSIGRYLNLSGGWSWQEVEDLVPGQDVGTVVTSDDDIRTRSEFENGWYASLTITLNDLPFFGSGKEE